MADDMKDWERIGNRLKEAREYLGLSQEDAAQVVGIKRSAISKIESGTRRVDAIELGKFAKLYRQPITSLSGDIADLPLPSSVQALARTASELSDKDRDALINFATFLQNKPKEP